MRRLDYKEQLIDYFKKNLKKGYTPDSLKFSLVKQGYSRTAVEHAFIEANKELAEKAPEFKEKPIITYQVIDENNQPITISKSWWEKFKNWLNS